MFFSLFFFFFFLILHLFSFSFFSPFLILLFNQDASIWCPKYLKPRPCIYTTEPDISLVILIFQSLPACRGRQTNITKWGKKGKKENDTTDKLPLWTRAPYHVRSPDGLKGYILQDGQQCISNKQLLHMNIIA